MMGKASQEGTIYRKGHPITEAAFCSQHLVRVAKNEYP